MSALIAGSMIPDFQYFIVMKLNGRFSHSLTGIFLFDLPAAIFVLIIFHAFVKDQLIDNLPMYINRRLQHLKAFNFFRYVKAEPIGLILCVLIGTVSHILWDGFTHNDGLFADWIPALHTVTQIKTLPDLPVYRYLQHISTILGAAWILFAFQRMPAGESSAKPDLRFWTLLTFFFAITFIIRSSFGIEYYGDTVVILVSSALVGLIIASVITRIKWNKT